MGTLRCRKVYCVFPTVICMHFSSQCSIIIMRLSLEVIFCIHLCWMYMSLPHTLADVFCLLWIGAKDIWLWSSDFVFCNLTYLYMMYLLWFFNFFPARTFMSCWITSDLLLLQWNLEKMPLEINLLSVQRMPHLQLAVCQQFCRQMGDPVICTYNCKRLPEGQTKRSGGFILI